MSIVKSAGELNGYVKKPSRYFIVRSFIKTSVIYVILQASVLHPLGENSRNPLDQTHIIAGYDIRMQTEPDPRITFSYKALFLFFRYKKCRFRTFHSQIYIPARVVHTPHGAHTAFYCIRKNAVPVQDYSVFFNIFIGSSRGIFLVNSAVGFILLVNGAVGFFLLVNGAVSFIFLINGAVEFILLIDGAVGFFFLIDGAV